MDQRALARPRGADDRDEWLGLHGGDEPCDEVVTPTVVVERRDAPGAVITRSGGDQHPLRKSERHDVAVVVVGVLADQVDPTRGSPDSHGLPASPSTESLRPGALASLLTRRTVSAEADLTTSSAGPRP